MWELDHKESWAPMNWCFWTVVLEKTLESPLDCKGIQPVHPKGSQSWIFLGRADAESLILWLPMRRTDSFEKTLMLGKLKAGEEDDRGWDGLMTSLTWKTRVWASSGLGEVQGSLVCCSPWGHKVKYNWTKLNWSSSQQKQNNNKHSYNSKSALIIKRSI